MNKFLISAAACALIANSALAQPVTMTDAQLDGVTADQNNNGNGYFHIGNDNGNGNF